MTKTMQTWDTNIASDWRWATSPSRPSLSELVIFDEYLSRFPRKTPILILGSTPEFRDLCFCHDFDTTVVDYNPETFHILGESLRHTDIAKLVVQDWRNMQLDRQFELVIGDLAINMVSIEEQSTVLKNIKKFLSRGGTLLHRVWTRDPIKYGRSKITLEELLREHDETRSNRHPFYSLALPFIQYYFDDEKKSTDFQQLLAGLGEAHTRGLINEEFLQAFQRPWGRYNLPNWLQTKDDLEKMMSKYFVTLSTKYGGDFYHEYCPIYIQQNSIL